VREVDVETRLDPRVASRFVGPGRDTGGIEGAHPVGIVLVADQTGVFERRGVELSLRHRYPAVRCLALDLETVLVVTVIGPGESELARGDHHHGQASATLLNSGPIFVGRVYEAQANPVEQTSD